jgi:GT2 family glycosyltransferase
LNVQPPFFSIVIPTYNRAELLRQALESVFQQEFRDFEVIVVDDGSTEDVSPIVEQYRDRVTFLRQENGGPGAARNAGARHAAGAYLAFLDSDDVWFPWTLRVFARLIRGRQSPAILSGRVVPITSEAELDAVLEKEMQCEAFADYFAASRHGHNAGAGTMVLRRDAFVRAGGFAVGQMNAEDHDLMLRMGMSPGFVKLRQPPSLGMRRHAGSVTADFRRTFAGASYLVRQEQRGAYPGGSTRARERREIISRHVRPVIVACLEKGMWPEAWELYRATSFWHIGLGRWRFLAAVPVMALLHRIRAFWLGVTGRLRHSIVP